jgi:O-antigen/teichoic acid export membrane protein
MRTRLVPTVTAASALVNVALNLVFVPRYGVVAAAVSTAISYAVLAAMHGALAQRLHPIRWEYGRWARMLALGIVWYLGGLALPIADSLPALAAKGLITLVAFPVSLALTGFFTRRELARLMQLVPERLRIG